MALPDADSSGGLPHRGCDAQQLVDATSEEPSEEWQPVDDDELPSGASSARSPLVVDRDEAAADGRPQSRWFTPAAAAATGAAAAVAGAALVVLAALAVRHATAAPSGATAAARGGAVADERQMASVADDGGGLSRAPCVWHRTGVGADACSGQGPLAEKGDISIEECRDTCNNDPRCSGMSFARETSKCSTWERIEFARETPGAECQWCQRMVGRVMEARFEPVDGGIDRVCEERAMLCEECCSADRVTCSSCLGYDPAECSSTDCLKHGDCEGCGCTPSLSEDGDTGDPGGGGEGLAGEGDTRDDDGGEGLAGEGDPGDGGGEGLAGEGDTSDDDPAGDWLGAPTRRAAGGDVAGGGDVAAGRRLTGAQDSGDSGEPTSTAGSLQECKQLCVGASSCQGVSYADGTGDCRLMTQMVSSEPKDGSACFAYRASLVPLDGGLNRACRGLDAGDDDSSYYDVHADILSLEDCKVLCLGTLLCSGVEFAEGGLCKVWWGQAVETTVHGIGKTCLKYPARAPASEAAGLQRPFKGGGRPPRGAALAAALALVLAAAAAL